MDRRRFFGRIALVTGGVALTAAFPWPAGHALAEPTGAAGLGSEHSASAGNGAPMPADWSIDDQWAPVPRNAEPIGYGRAHSNLASTNDDIGRGSAPALGAVGSIDALFFS